MSGTAITLLDGAVGTSLWAKARDKVPVWRYNLEQPEIVRELHREYLDAGSRIILANTFGANRIAVRSSGFQVDEVVSAGVRLAREELCGRAETALSIGPLSVLLEPYGDLSEAEAFEIFDEQISAGVSQQPDLIVFQTFMDLEMLRVALRAAVRHNLPIFCMMTFTEVGKTMMGNSVQDFVEGVREFPVAALGLNCSIGPDKAVPVMAQFRQYTDLPLLFKPNAGRPISDGVVTSAEYDADVFVEDCMPALACDIQYIGGCCGSDPTYIRALRDRLQLAPSAGAARIS